jgi:hypothetical protein
LQILVATVMKIIYNVYFRHRGIPTKTMISMTDWGLWRFAINGTSHLKTAELHKELGIDSCDDVAKLTAGDVVRIQPNHISFNSVKALEDIYGTRSVTLKGPFYDHVLRPSNFPTNLLNVM